MFQILTLAARAYAFESCAGELAARLMNSDYAVFYHEHVLNKEPGRDNGERGGERKQSYASFIVL